MIDEMFLKDLQVISVVNAADYLSEKVDIYYVRSSIEEIKQVNNKSSHKKKFIRSDFNKIISYVYNHRFFDNLHKVYFDKTLEVSPKTKCSKTSFKILKGFEIDEIYMDDYVDDNTHYVLKEYSKNWNFKDTIKLEMNTNQWGQTIALNKIFYETAHSKLSLRLRNDLLGGLSVKFLEVMQKFGIRAQKYNLGAQGVKISDILGDSHNFNKENYMIECYTIFNDVLQEPYMMFIKLDPSSLSLNFCLSTKQYRKNQLARDKGNIGILAGAKNMSSFQYKRRPDAILPSVSDNKQVKLSQVILATGQLIELTSTKSILKKELSIDKNKSITPTNESRRSIPEAQLFK